MNTNLRQLRNSSLVFLGLFSACSGGDINFPDWQPVIPPGPPGTLQFAVASYDITEGAVVNIAVVRNGGNFGVVSVDYATVDGTAVGGSDYTAANGRLTWLSGVVGTQNISIPITDDDTAEGPESFTVTLSNVSRATLGPRSSTTINIADNDVAAVKAFGALTGLNDATVNGIRYDTNDSTVSVDGLPANVSDLKLGQFVEIAGDINFSDATGMANRIEYSASVIGPVENIDAKLQQLTVLGQTVLTNADTVFEASIDPQSFTGLTPGETIRISGFRDGDGGIIATRIEPDTTRNGVQLVGTVAGLDLANMTFSVNRLSVDYSNAALVDLPMGMPANGLRVIARGSLLNGILIVDELAN